MDMTEPFRLVLVAGLMTVFATVLLGCGPATVSNNEPTPIHPGRSAALHAGGSDPPLKPNASAAAVDARPVGAPDSAPRLVLPEAEPIGPGHPLRKVSAGSGRDLVGQHASSRVSSSEPTGDSVRTQPAQERPYTWQDGDRTMTVLLQSDLAVTPGGRIGSSDDTALRMTRANTVSESASPVQPVFRSQSGTLMTLPGGVLLALDETWSSSEIAEFFESNGIDSGRVSELGDISNGFFVDTQPGFPSLDLANALAAQDGVRVSTPNWRRALVAE